MNAPGTPNSKPLAFVVDDEPMLLDLNESILRSLGFDVHRFRAAELALEAYRIAPVPPAIIVTDYAMHRMTGMDLIVACRQLHPGQKFLLVSGTVDASVFKDSAVKPDHFMTKPYALDEFAAAVRALTGE
jgi:DNA-binding NtrC family response regulator